MPWWAWVLLLWAVAATACAVWWGRALANADTRDQARRLADETQAELDADEEGFL